MFACYTFCSYVHKFTQSTKKMVKIGDVLYVKPTTKSLSSMSAWMADRRWHSVSAGGAGVFTCKQ